jgi:hypothetical protein
MMSTDITNEQKTTPKPRTSYKSRLKIAITIGYCAIVSAGQAIAWTFIGGLVVIVVAIFLFMVLCLILLLADFFSQSNPIIKVTLTSALIATFIYFFVKALKAKLKA